MAAPGDSFLLRKPNYDFDHLWIVLTAPHPQNSEIIIVNVTGQQGHSDTTTILIVGEHPFVKKPSVIHYADARKTDSKLIDQALARGLASSHRQCSKAFLTKIQSGLLASPHTTPMIRAAFLSAQRDGRT